MSQVLRPLDITPQTDQPVLSYSNLLQELLLALGGFQGDVFVSTQLRSPVYVIPAPDKCDLQLSQDLTWVEAPDRDLIQKLLKLAYHFLAIRQFVEHEREGIIDSVALPLASASQGGHISDTGGSIYRRALASGLNEALYVYQTALVALEKKVLGSPQDVTLSALLHELHDFKVLLPQLHTLVWRVSGSDKPGADTPEAALIPRNTQQGADRLGPLVGAEVLVLVHELAADSMPVVQSCASRLLWHCNQALLKQLASWMVYGHLSDPHDEFFIRPLHLHVSQAQHTQQSNPTGKPMHKYDVVTARLPPTVTLDTAKDIAFIGQAVLLLNNPAGEFRGRQLMPHQDTLHAAKVLSDLQASQSLNRVQLERSVEALKTKVAALLWQLVVQQAGLMTHLTAMKDYYLLAKGEFFHAFLGEAKRLLALPPRPDTADAQLSSPWQQAALKSSAQYDPLFGNFKIRWASTDPNQRADLPPQAHTPPVADIPSYDPNWDGLWLDTSVEWPLGLVLSDHALARYNAVFQLVLRLRRVELALEESWLTLAEMSKRQRTAQSSDPLLVKLQRLRHMIANLITNLQIYIQVDVIESNFAQLEQRVATAQDFTQVEKAHSMYLHYLMTQCFLTTPTVRTIVSTAFRLVSELCLLVDTAHQQRLITSSPQPAPMSPAKQKAYDQCDALERSLKQLMQNVYVVLNSSSLQSTQMAPYLRQLYLRLNYNNYLVQALDKQGYNTTQGTQQAGRPTATA